MNSDCVGSVPHVHLSVIAISALEEADECEVIIPHACSPTTMTLQPKTNGVCMCRAAQAIKFHLLIVTQTRNGIGIYLF